MNKSTLNYLAALFISVFLMVPVVVSSGQSVKDFEASGKPVFLIFTNVHSSFNKDGNSPAFEVNRLYLGYEYNFSKSLYARANIDIGNPGNGGLQMTAYVKHAFLQYRNNKGFSARLGMIGTDQFSLIEKQWDHRYVSKTLQDEFGFGPSSDLGAAVEYSPANFISLDASVLNGEGYKKLQADSALKYTFGLTIRPVEGLQLRAYTDFMKKEHLQNTLSFFAGYTCKPMKLGLEYSIQKNNRMIDGNDLSGVSAFASVRLNDKFSAFSRYDNLWSATQLNSDVPWNYITDGQFITAGIEYSPLKGVRIAPLYMAWIPANHDKPINSTLGMYFEIKL